MEYTFNKLLSSLCDFNHCQERRRIIVDTDRNHVLHFRIDGVFITDTTIKKNDCLITYEQTGAAHLVLLLLIEVKETSYTITEVKTQLQNGRNILNDVFHSIEDNLGSVDDIYTLLPNVHRSRATARLVSSLLNCIRTNRYRFVPILYAKSNSELRRLKRYRLGFTRHFKIKTGKGTTPIMFIDHRTDIVAHLHKIATN